MLDYTSMFSRVEHHTLEQILDGMAKASPYITTRLHWGT